MKVWPRINAPRRKIGYARVSTRDQKLRMQREALEAVGCDMIFEDHGVSGKLGSRDGLDDMLDELSTGDTVVVFKLDRLGRSVLHLADLLVRFESDCIYFCSLCEGVNTTTAGGRFIYHTFSALAEFQRDLIVENTVLGLRAARKRGVRLGRPPVIPVERVVAADRLIHQKGKTLTEVATLFKVNRTTLRRSLRRLRQDGLEIGKN